MSKLTKEQVERVLAAQEELENMGFTITSTDLSSSGRFSGQIIASIGVKFERATLSEAGSGITFFISDNGKKGGKK